METIIIIITNATAAESLPGTANSHSSLAPCRHLLIQRINHLTATPFAAQLGANEPFRFKITWRGTTYNTA